MMELGQLTVALTEGFVFFFFFPLKQVITKGCIAVGMRG